MHFDALPPVPDCGDPEEPRDPETRLWLRLADAGVVVGPGTIFAADPDARKENEGHYRISFSYPPVRPLALLLHATGSLSAS